MPRIAFMGAGSTIFAKSVLGDCILTPEIKDLEIALHDIDPVRLEDSRKMLENHRGYIRDRRYIQGTAHYTGVGGICSRYAGGMPGRPLHQLFQSYGYADRISADIHPNPFYWPVPQCAGLYSSAFQGT